MGCLQLIIGTRTQAFADINPLLLGQWGQMQQTYGSMNASDQMQYSESMVSMKADAASMGCFLD